MNSLLNLIHTKIGLIANNNGTDEQAANLAEKTVNLLIAPAKLSLAETPENDEMEESIKKLLIDYTGNYKTVLISGLTDSVSQHKQVENFHIVLKFELDDKSILQFSCNVKYITSFGIEGIMVDVSLNGEDVTYYFEAASVDAQYYEFFGLILFGYDDYDLYLKRPCDADLMQIAKILDIEIPIHE